ncbi:hypothetical protein RA28_08105 [Ruegeria sp. ANG-S4]|uniref:hypothetical protein n=1 Tax=Ruegeria sp. ANG-S4 TaxID=1577904 RepID=UPI00057CA8AA|nr:hypothetical protein [Ruegeria sp. ANG-S4]KIC45671.1 hypothetical protein RA28_08105 [Ruegeria sp. ANG-S4]
MPTANLSVQAVPPQMMKLLSLLGLQGTASGQARADMKLNAMLPAMTPDIYLKATMAANAPNIALPPILPTDGGGAISLMMRLVATGYPLTDPRALLAEVQQAVVSMAKNVLPQAQTIPKIPAPQMQNITLAAKMTLALRAQGVCPMALAGLDFSHEAKMELGEAGGSRGTCSAALNFAAKLPRITMPPFALPLPKVNLARQLALMAPAATAPAAMGLPAVSDPNLMKTLMSQLAALSTIPIPNLPVSLEDLQAMADQLQDLATIQEAFGPDALTPAGIARINAMLSYIARLNIPVPLEAQSLQMQLDALPKIDDVTQGAQATQSGAMNLAASMSVQPPAVPILPTLEALKKLAKSLPGLPLGPCDACNTDIGSIRDSLAGMQLPAPPPIPTLPSFT